ncbi:MAG: hypothetical protein AAFV43_09680 [Planctomycetota bacterium]
MLLIVFLGVGGRLDAQVVGPIAWDSVQGVSSPRLFGINVWDGTDPNVSAQPGYASKLAAVSPGPVRIHSVETLIPGNQKAWVDSSFEWQPQTIDAVLSNVSPVVGELMLNVPRWPSMWNESGSSRLDPSRYTDYADFVAELLDIANNQLGHDVGWIEPFNEVDPLYDGNTAELATIHNAVVAAARAVDPDIKIGAGAWLQPFDDTDIRQFVNAVGAANMDAFTYHHYATSSVSTDRNFLYDRAASGSSSVAGRGRAVRDILDDLPGGDSVELWLSETNVYSSFDKDTTGLMAGGAGAVWDALLHASAIRRGDVDVIQPWNDSDGTYGKFTPDASQLRPAGHVRELMASLMVGEWVTAFSFAPDDLQVFAVVEGDRHAAMLINRSGAPLDVELSGFSTNGFMDQFEVHTVDDSGLSIDNESISSHGGLSFALGADSVQFVVFTERLAGDYNGDGLVGAIDYTIWRDTLGSVTELAADGDNDGEVTLADYDVWRDNFGASASGESVTIPEPTALIQLLAVALVAAFAYRVCRAQGRANG